MLGAATVSINTSTRVFTAEITSVNLRPYVSTVHNMFCQLGVMAFTLLVYLVPNMVNMELMVGLFGIFYIPLMFILPESPRWLLAKGKINEANAVIKNICKWNNRYTTVVSAKMDGKLVRKCALFRSGLFMGFRPKRIGMTMTMIPKKKGIK